MSNITDWIKYELYPTLYDHIDRALPEFQFKRRGKNWISSNRLKITGETGDSAGKVYVWENAPGYIKDFTRETKSIIDYIMEREGKKFMEAVELLAGMAGLQPPTDPSFNPARYQEKKDRELLLEQSNDYFKYCLQTSTNAKQTKEYLASRGYTEQDIEAMDLGYIPSQKKLNDYLLGKGYSQEDIDKAINLKIDTRIGSSHSLTIPYRSGGTIRGFKFRTTGNTTPKYLNSYGLPKGESLFNLKGIRGDKDLIIVEGELDSLHATAKGLDNVVALAGSSLTEKQVKDAIRRGAGSFTICLDREPGKESKTVSTVYNVIRVIQAENVNRVYIAELPDLGGGKTDPDRLVRERGIKALEEIVKRAVPYYKYLLLGTIEKYPEPMTDKELDKLLGDIVGIAVDIEDPIDRDRYKSLFIEGYAKGLGIGPEALDETIENISRSKDRDKQDRKLRELYIEASRLQDEGKIPEAVELIKSGVIEIKQIGSSVEYGSLLIPAKESEIRERLANREDSLHSGYKIGSEELLLPSGAVSIVASPTSHGKTSFLINTALNLAENYPAKEIYLFSYEEDQETIILKALNMFINDEIDRYNHDNLRALKNYYRTGDSKYIHMEPGIFEQKRNDFFKDLIETRRLNITYGSYNSEELMGAINYLYKNANPGAVLIDYIQLLNLPAKTNSRQEELKEVCLALKDLAVETGLPIILGSQFNREVTSPLKLHSTKLGEAGDIERVANIILGLWNGNFRALDPSNTERKELEEKIVKDRLYAEILKNRGGRVGSYCLLDFNGNTGKITNIKSSKRF